MGTDEFPIDNATEDCTTTKSFADHDLLDGSELIRRTYYRLATAEDVEFAPTDRFFDALESAFVWAYLDSVDEHGVPDHVGAAVDDALAFTAEEYADRPDADLRTDVLPTFYTHVADFHCEYRE